MRKTNLVDGKYLPSTTSVLLDNIKYYPDGNAPSEHNAWAGEKHWWVADQPIGFIATRSDGKKVSIGLAQNPADRYVDYISKKWATERDWIPEYRYDLEDCKTEVWLVVQQALQSGVARKEINKLAFHRLDEVYKAHRDYKTDERTEIENNGLRYIFAMLFMGDVNSLPPQLAYYDADGNELAEPTVCPLPTKADADELIDEYSFAKLETIFRQAKDNHNASSETWLCALYFALGLPTEKAVKLIYGDRAVGKKKKRSCEVAYSRHHEDVYEWLLEAAEDMGNYFDLHKWLLVAGRQKATEVANSMWQTVKKYGLMEVNAEIDTAMIKFIETNPHKAWDYLNPLMDKVPQHNQELADDDEKNIAATLQIAVANGIELPF